MTAGEEVAAPSAEAAAPKPRRSVRFAFYAFQLVLMLVILEVAARLGVVACEAFLPVRPPELHAYQMPDPEHPGNWTLRPGFSTTFGHEIEARRAAGRTLQLGKLEAEMRELGYSRDEIAFTIDSDGFKGPEVDASHSKFRILNIGDSCTFGLLYERHTYPRSLERRLRELGADVEVINGGVEGYAPANALLRVNHFKALRPELTTIYIGWNAIFADVPGHRTKESHLLESAWLVERAVEKIDIAIHGAPEVAMRKYAKPKHPDPNARQVQALKSYIPPSINQVEALVDEMASVGSKVVLVTLPTLFTLDEWPSDEALQMGHLPENTDNPFTLAMLSMRFNLAVRELAKRKGLAVIDLDGWSKRVLKPRHAYFFDSVHLVARAQQMIGYFMAEELVTDVKAGAKSRHETLTP